MIIDLIWAPQVQAIGLGLIISALEVFQLIRGFYDNALYKFTFHIHIQYSVAYCQSAWISAVNLLAGWVGIFEAKAGKKPVCGKHF